jgi:hypothetical protein
MLAMMSLRGSCARRLAVNVVLEKEKNRNTEEHNSLLKQYCLDRTRKIELTTNT